MTRRRGRGRGRQGQQQVEGQAQPAQEAQNEGQRVRSDDVRKRFLMYKCENQDCGKKWNSVHGWKTTVRMYQEPCRTCNSGVGRPTNIEEGMSWLDCYSCSGCDERWSCLQVQPEDGQQREGLMACINNCDLAMVTLEGTQRRHCKTISYNCNNNRCGSQWTSPNFEKEYTQKCQECRQNGIILGSGITDKVRVKGKRLEGVGGHDVEGCDMCYELKRYGMNCTTSNRVTVKEFLAPNGRVKTDIAAVFYGRGSRRPPPND